MPKFGTIDTPGITIDCYASVNDCNSSDCNSDSSVGSDNYDDKLCVEVVSKDGAQKQYLFRGEIFAPTLCYFEGQQPGDPNSVFEYKDGVHRSWGTLLHQRQWFLLHSKS